ncbi:sensor histidine kinase [Kitasatospora sp. NPDC056446]|uniref:sensor histidine kinase n=1 Tax=Kitasatospora sp. NPDC056446 TaxID=3345819 RepID=UPI0036A4E8BC
MQQPTDQSAAGLDAPPDGPPLPDPPLSLPRPLRALAPTVLVLLVLVPLAANDPDFGPTTSPQVNAGLMAFGGLALTLRRRSPAAVTAATLLSGQLPLAVALYGLAARRGTTRLLCVLAAVAELRLLVPFDLGDVSTPSSLANLIEDPLVFGAVPLALGLTAHNRARTVRVLAERNRLLGERNRLLEEARRHAGERAAVAERARLAREMHDVVSNRVSLITLHAGAGQVAQAEDPAAVRETLGLIRTLGLQALTELRGLLGVLTTTAEPPSLRGLPTLVEESRQAGLAVGLTVTGPADGLPAPEPAVQYAAYRIVQEALTNAHKHAPAAEVAVTVEVRTDGLRLAVVNSPTGPDGSPTEGSGAADHGAAGAGAPDPGAPDPGAPDPGATGPGPAAGGPELPSGGHGLTGMRSRAGDLGGTLHAGPTPEGGFAVRARLPLGAG